MVAGAACARDLAWELGMKKQAGSSKRWTRPEVRRLGEIKDVAGAQTPVTQAALTKS